MIRGVKYKLFHENKLLSSIGDADAPGTGLAASAVRSYKVNFLKKYGMGREKPFVIV